MSGWRRCGQRSSARRRCVISRSLKPSAHRLQRRSRPRAREWSRSAWRHVERSTRSRAPLGVTRALRRIRERRKQRLRGVRSSPELYSRAKRGRGSSCSLAGGSYAGFIALVGRSQGPIWRRSFRGGEGRSDARERVALVSQPEMHRSERFGVTCGTVMNGLVVEIVYVYCGCFL